MRPLPPLSLIETRVVGVLFEKQRTVPDTYPLTLNSLVSGCNQKTSRAPVIEASDAQVQEALDALKGLSLVIESSGGRVTRYEHNLLRVLQVPEQSAALLAALMLRGPQTPGELRIACERLHRFADISAVEAFLAELASREAGALVAQLPRLPGAREHRWAHLLSGAPVIDEPQHVQAGGDVSPRELDALRGRVAMLEAQVGELKALLGRVCGELGISSEPGPGAPT
jgi:uncharacterized protein YceH (UPF0502 family)